MPMFLLDVGVIMGGDTKIIYSEEMHSLESQDQEELPTKNNRCAMNKLSLRMRKWGVWWDTKAVWRKKVLFNSCELVLEGFWVSNYLQRPRLMWNDKLPPETNVCLPAMLASSILLFQEKFYFKKNLQTISLE